MSTVEYLREFVNERLTAAAEEIFRVFNKTVFEYEEEIDRQRRRLDIICNPKIKLHRIELPQQLVCNEEEVLTDQQLCIQERNSSQEGEQLEVEQETESFMLTPTEDESDHSEDQTLNLKPDDTLNAAERESVVNMPVISSVVSEPESRHQLDIIWKPRIKLHRIKLPQQHVCKEEDVLTDQQLCIQERNCSLDQEDPEPPQIKGEQEGEQLEVKQETETFILTPTYGESDHSEDQALYFNSNDTQCAAEKESVVNMPVISSVVSEAHLDHQLLSHKSHVAESQDQKGGKNGDSGSTSNAEPKSQIRPHKSRSHSNNVNISKMLMMHDNTHTGKQSFICDTCGKDCKYKSQLQRHMRVHSGERPYSCKTCGKDFKCSSNLGGHMSIHTGKLYACKTCGKRFSRPSNLKSHLRSHTDEKPYSCKTCGKAFRCSSYLKVHMRTHTGEKPYLCKTCGKAFSDVRVLKKHTRIHTGEKPYSCKTCGKDFRFMSKLQRHMSVHTGEKPCTCKTCGKAFRCNGNLRVHMRTHTGKLCACKTCGKRFSVPSKLKKHMRSHTDEKPYSCKTCGKAFRSGDYLKVHMRTHTGEKPYLCKTCGKAFFAVWVLNKHTRIHTGEKPYTCKTCGKAFGRNSTLTVHTRTHTGEEPFSCKTCGKGYRSKKGLLGHMKRAHAGEMP